MPAKSRSSYIIAAIPTLLVLSIVTFAIIQAPPGDYGDFIKSNMKTQGNATEEAAQAAAAAWSAAAISNCPRPRRGCRWCATCCAISDNPRRPPPPLDFTATAT